MNSLPIDLSDTKNHDINIEGMRYILYFLVYKILKKKYGNFVEAQYLLNIFLSDQNIIFQRVKNEVSHLESTLLKCLQCGHFMNHAEANEIIGLTMGRLRNVSSYLIS